MTERTPRLAKPTVAESRLAWVLRAALVATVLAHVVRGEYLFALFCALGIGLIVIPSAYARSGAGLPVEVELLFLVILVGDMTFGRLLGLYSTSGTFDKWLHLGNSVMLGYLAFLFISVLHLVGQPRTPPAVDAVLIVLLTLGLGAAWELGEWASDKVFAFGAQGSPSMLPLEDTMWDLLLDLAGGVVSAVLGPLYLRWSKRSRSRLDFFVALNAHRAPLHH